MDKKILLEWEKYLREEKNQKYIKNREILSKRFSKKKLIEVFESWKIVLETKNKGFDERFKMTFISQVLNPIKESFWMEFVKKSTYSSLMSTFSKFIYFLRDYKKQQQSLLNIKIDNWKEIQTGTKEEIKHTLNITENEKDIFSVDSEWNILPPQSAGEFKEETSFKIKKRSKKRCERGADDWQLSLDFL